MTDHDAATSGAGSLDLAGEALRRGKRLRRQRQTARRGAAGSLVLVLSAGLAIGVVHASSGPSVVQGGGGSTTATTVAGPSGSVVPADFRPGSFTAVSLDEWWMLGTARCGTGSGTCLAIVRTTDGGSSFASIPSPPVSPGDVTQLRFANARDGYAFGPQLWETTDGGASWGRLATPGAVTELEAADGEAYALTCFTSSASCRSMRLQRSVAGSGTWQQLSTPARLTYGAQFAVSGQNLYVLSGNEPPLFLLYSSDGGATFGKRVDPCVPGLGGRLTAAVVGDPELWAACPTGTMAGAWLSGTDGRTWHAAGSGRTGGFPNSLGLAAASSSVALAWPGPEISGETPASLGRTTNGGQTYSAVLSRAGRVSWAGFSYATRAYALLTPTKNGTNGPPSLFESNDGGLIWHRVAIKD